MLFCECGRSIRDRLGLITPDSREHRPGPLPLNHYVVDATTVTIPAGFYDKPRRVYEIATLRIWP